MDDPLVRIAALCYHKDIRTALKPYVCVCLWFSLTSIFFTSQISLALQFYWNISAHLHGWLTSICNLKHRTTKRYFRNHGPENSTEQAGPTECAPRRHITWRSWNTLRIPCFSYKWDSCFTSGNASRWICSRWKKPDLLNSATGSLWITLVALVLSGFKFLMSRSAVNFRSHNFKVMYDIAGWHRDRTPNVWSPTLWYVCGSLKLVDLRPLVACSSFYALAAVTVSRIFWARLASVNKVFKGCSRYLQ